MAGGGWSRFRQWPWWAQALAWVAAWPVPLVLLAVADPQRRRVWAGAAAASSLVWLALVVDASRSPTASDATQAASTGSTAITTTTSERRATSTTSTTDVPAPEPEPDPAPGFHTAPGTTGGLSTWGSGVFSVDELLDQLTVAAETDPPGYDRDLFRHWTDDDGDGCDTRAEVLRSESDGPVTTSGRCRVETGSWLSIYDGYSTPDASELEVDHLVALHEAWQSGAATWEPQRRQAFANDLGHPGALVAVTAAMNRIKSDRDPASWQPPNRASWCLYAADWTTVKVRWGLTADEAEVTALRNMLAGCGGSPGTSAASPPPAPATVAGAGGSCESSYPDVCIPPAPPDLDCGDIPHRRFRVVGADPHGFDGDRDGVGCESG